MTFARTQLCGLWTYHRALNFTFLVSFEKMNLLKLIDASHSVSILYFSGSYPVSSEYDEECGGIGVPAFSGSDERRRGKDVRVYSEEIPENYSTDGENLWHNHGSDDSDGRKGRLPPLKAVTLNADAKGTFDSQSTDPRGANITPRKASRGREPSIPESASGSEPGEIR
jgi:hypothetical protein